MPQWPLYLLYHTIVSKYGFLCQKPIKSRDSFEGKLQVQQLQQIQNTSSLFFFMGSLEKSSEAEVVTITVEKAKELLNARYLYLDVRTVEEYKKGHPDTQKTLNIPYMFIKPEGRVKNSGFLKEVSSILTMEDCVVVGCQSGVRSLYAAADLLEAGFKKMSNMGGGYVAWVEGGFPIKIEDESITVL